VIVERDVHPKKQLLQISLTEEGIQIDERDEQFLNAYSKIHQTLEPRSNVILERDLHSLKHSREIPCTKAGIQIDETDEQL
jgi:hypothetical protein